MTAGLNRTGISCNITVWVVATRQLFVETNCSHGAMEGKVKAQNRPPGERPQTSRLRKPSMPMKHAHVVVTHVRTTACPTSNVSDVVHVPPPQRNWCPEGPKAPTLIGRASVSVRATF